MSDTTSRNIIESDNEEFNDAVKIDYTLTENAVGVLSAGVYSATTTLTLRKPLPEPPKILSFRKDIGNETNILLPEQVVVFYPGLIFGFLDGVVCESWTRSESFLDRVVITAYSKTPFTHEYVVYILKNKENVRN